MALRSRATLRASLAAALGLAVLGAGCGPSYPRRWVTESDLGDWRYRRYQHLLDVDFPIEGNAADGHTATYVRRVRRGDDHVPYATAFVTVYENAAGLAAEIRRHMREMMSYEVANRAVAGGWVWSLDGGPGDRWVLWVSGSRVVKVGASAELEEIPADVVAHYMGMYPSDLDEHGRARPGTPSAGDPRPREAEGPQPGEDMPAYLRRNAPR